MLGSVLGAVNSEKKHETGVSIPFFPSRLALNSRDFFLEEEKQKKKKKLNLDSLSPKLPPNS